MTATLVPFDESLPAWERARRPHRRPQVYGARPKRPYLLAGVAVCSGCGAPLWANTTGGGRNSYYRCSSRSRGGICSNHKTSCRSEQPENEVGSLFSRLELPPSWRQRVEALARKSSTTKDGDRERRRLEEKIGRVRQGLVDGVLDNETAKREVLAAEAALATLREQDDAHIQEAEALTDIHQLWPQMTMEERRDLVRLVLAKVEVDLRTGGVEGLTPKPAFAPLFRVLAEEEDGLISVCNWRPRGGMGSTITNRSALGRVIAGEGCVTSVNRASSATSWEVDARS